VRDAITHGACTNYCYVFHFVESLHKYSATCLFALKMKTF